MIVVLLVGGGAFAAVSLASWLTDSSEPNGSTSTTSPVASVDSTELDTKAAASPPRFPVTIRKPAGPPSVLTGRVDMHGQPVTASCSHCHATRPADLTNRTVADLKEFHTEVNVKHGQLSCLACHNTADYDSLKLADGARVEYSDVMTLCGQCHGPQLRDYQHGAHGGMNGYWDRTRGPQMKLNCVDCHHPHHPQFPHMTPTFKPKDRFLQRTEAEH